MGRALTIDSSDYCFPQFRRRNLLGLLLLLSGNIVTHLLSFESIAL